MFGLHIYRLEDDGSLRVEGANAIADAMLGVDRNTMLGKILEDVLPSLGATDWPARCRQVASEGGGFTIGNVAIPRAQGEVLLNLSTFSLAPNRMAVVFRDMTAQQLAEAERAHLLAQLAQAQKLESMGRLVGGVVHDFNNLLHGIMGQMDFCRDELGAEHPVHAHLNEIASEAQRSARLVKQLLAVVSRQKIAPEPLDINESVAGVLKLLQRLLGEDIELVWQPDAAAGLIHMDPSQFDQLLTNLAVNARDAIQGVGRLTIQTRQITLDQPFAGAPPAFTPGEYVALTLRDTGCGMDAETHARIFEPFFTTKPVGKGSGLGLATVQRVIQENHGFITVQSAPGEGTVFEIYLPRQQEDTLTEVPPAEALPVGGSETILLVEDEKIIRLTTARMLQKLGYTVLMAESPAEALQLVAAQRAPIQLLLTDVVLPGMTGSDLAGKLTQEYPGLKCLFMSGHTADVVASRGHLADEAHFIGKPFTRDMFALKLREGLSDSSPQINAD